MNPESAVSYTNCGLGIRRYSERYGPSKPSESSSVSMMR